MYTCLVDLQIRGIGNKAIFGQCHSVHRIHRAYMQLDRAQMTCADTGFFWVIGPPPPPPTAVCNFVLLVDLPRTLQQFGSAPEIPVRTPRPL